jgi:tRNA pseudouridine55 synthase
MMLSEPSGVLLVDKPKGWTSNDVCQCIKRHFQFKKVGHGGTLDPFATGLLVLYLNRATRLAHRGLQDEKEYEAWMQLGLVTTTGDPEGAMVSKSDLGDLSKGQVQNHIQNFLGTYWQLPPMTSAIKKNGVPLYRMARKGIEVKREKRLCHISSLTMQQWALPMVQLRARVSKGTYIRVLAQDLGEKIGVGASLSELRRIASGNYQINQAVSIDVINEMKNVEDLKPYLRQPARDLNFS